MKLCQLEFATRDLEASLRFLEAIGWKRVPVSIQDQILFEVPGDSPYGLSLKAVKKNASETVFGPLAYFEISETLHSLRQTILAAGASLITDITPVIGYGEILVAEDAGGLRLGFYEAKVIAPRQPKLSKS